MAPPGALGRTQLPITAASGALSSSSLVALTKTSVLRVSVSLEKAPLLVGALLLPREPRSRGRFLHARRTEDTAGAGECPP